MNENLIIGLLTTFVPLFAVGYLMLNKQPPIFRMFIAMLLVGLGYLTMTGAVEDIGARVTGKATPIEVTVPAAAEKTAAPAAEKAPEPAPAPAAEKPADAAPAPAGEADKPAPAADPNPGAPKPAQ